MTRTLSTRLGRRNKAAGFTLVELMVTVLVSAIVIGGIYTIYTVSVRGYRVQDQTLQAYAQLRQGMLQLRADLRSAGFNGPSQSAVEPWVRTIGTANPLAALTVEPLANPPIAHPTLNQNIQPVELTLLGDFESHQTFRTLFIAGETVTIEWGPDNGTEAVFDRIFSEPNLAKVEMYGRAREEQIIPIVSAEYNGGLNPEITLSAAVQDVGGFGAENELTVLSWYRYRLVLDERRNAVDSVKTDLVRERLDAAGDPVDGTWLALAEYVVDLQVYDICLNVTPLAGGTHMQLPVNIQCFPDLTALETAGFSLAPGIDNDAHLLRALTIKLAVRTPYEDQDVPFAPRSAVNRPLHAYELDPVLQGAARVFEMASMVVTTGIQSRRQ